MGDSSSGRGRGGEGVRGDGARREKGLHVRWILLCLLSSAFVGPRLIEYLITRLNYLIIKHCRYKRLVA